MSRKIDYMLTPNPLPQGRGSVYRIVPSGALTVAVLCFFSVLILASLTLAIPEADEEVAATDQPLTRNVIDGLAYQPKPLSSQVSRTPFIAPEVVGAITTAGFTGSLQRRASPATPADSMGAQFADLLRIEQLEDLPVDLAVFELGAMLSKDDPAIRMAALEAIVAMSHPARLSVAVTALGDPVPEVRIMAIEVVTDRNDASAWQHIEPLLHDAEQDVRMAAIDAFAILENEASAHGLAGLLADTSGEIRHSAVHALGDIGGEVAYSYLQQMVHDPDPAVREDAKKIIAEALGIL